MVHAHLLHGYYLNRPDPGVEYQFLPVFEINGKIVEHGDGKVFPWANIVYYETDSPY